MNLGTGSIDGALKEASALSQLAKNATVLKASSVVPPYKTQLLKIKDDIKLSYTSASDANGPILVFNEFYKYTDSSVKIQLTILTIN